MNQLANHDPKFHEDDSMGKHDILKAFRRGKEKKNAPELRPHPLNDNLFIPGIQRAK